MLCEQSAALIASLGVGPEPKAVCHNNNDRICITSGTCSLNAKLDPVFVANADVSATSNIYVSQEDNDTIVIVADGKYTISGLKNGTEVKIDNITFTYDASSDSLTYNTKSYKSVVDGTISLSIECFQLKAKTTKVNSFFIIPVELLTWE